LRRAINSTDWSVTDYLIADLIDTERLALWQRGANKTTSKPEPYPRPGVKQAKEASLRAKAEAFRKTQKKGRG
jgi:hypothetical protein